MALPVGKEPCAGDAVVGLGEHNKTDRDLRVTLMQADEHLLALLKGAAVILVPVQKEQRDAEFRLLQEAWKFQPELYKRIELLATTEDLEEYTSQMEKQAERAMQKALNRLLETNRETVTQMQSLISQDGKMQEKFISDSSRALDSRIADLNGEIRRLKKTGLWFVIGTMISSVILSGLASALLLRLLG